MKKQLFLFLMVILPMMASADDSGSCGENVTYSYVESTHTLTISGTGAMWNYTENYAPWYNYRSEIVKAVIEDGVTSIGNLAFYRCSGLTSVTIPNSVTSVGYGAFSRTSLYKNSSDGVFYVDNWVCGYKGTMPSNANITLKDGLLGIANNAFSGCSGLTNVTIPNSVRSIGNDAFYGCSGLTSVTIPNSVTSIGEQAFWGCSGLTSIIMGNGVTSIGYKAFSDTGWYNNQDDGILYLGNWLIGWKEQQPTGDYVIQVSQVPNLPV